MKKFLKKLIPNFVFSFYYYFLAIVGAIIYGFPSRKLIVIGVTGTKGKTSVINYVWSCLSAGGDKVGLISTANVKIGLTESLNKYHMTMPGRFTIQKLMARMVREGCKYCLVEVTSEGIKQFRHKGIIFDVAVFTNLTPEHLTSHGGSFEKYKQTKGKLFSSLKHKNKIINDNSVQTLIVANIDDSNANYYLNFSADKKISFALNAKADFKADDIVENKDHTEFSVSGDRYKLMIPGVFNVYNALPAIAIAKHFGLSQKEIVLGLNSLSLIPGRMEKINEGQDFLVYVDYAHEKQSMKYILDTARKLITPNDKVIVLLGAEGGGRDKAKRADMGALAGELADYVFVTNVDPYDDEPKQIIEDIATVVESKGKVRNLNLFTNEDRRESIKQALFTAKEGDIVMITGKGAEQSMIIAGGSIPWDDRVVVREELKKVLNK